MMHLHGWRKASPRDSKSTKSYPHILQSRTPTIPQVKWNQRDEGHLHSVSLHIFINIYVKKTNTFKGWLLTRVVDWKGVPNQGMTTTPTRARRLDSTYVSGASRRAMVSSDSSPLKARSSLASAARAPKEGSMSLVSRNSKDPRQDSGGLWLVATIYRSLERACVQNKSY